MQSSPGKLLRAAIAESTIQIPGVTCALTARLVEAAGFHAACLSTAALAAQRALHAGAIPLDELVRETAQITRVLSIPLLVDFGPAAMEASQLAEALSALSKAGAAAVVFAVGSPTEVAHAQRDGEVIGILRTLARRVSLDEAIASAKALGAAGAEWILPDGLKSYQEYEQFADEIDAPLVADMDEFGASPLLTGEELAELGYAGVLYPKSLLRVAMKAMEGALESLAETGSQHEFLEIMQTERDLERLLRGR
jgi:methylisocitrate lyase